VLGHLLILYRNILFWVARIRFSLFNVKIGKGAYVHHGSWIVAETEMGDHTRINGPITIKGDYKLTIGRYRAIGSDVKIISSNHDSSHLKLQLTTQDSIGTVELVSSHGCLVIGNNVWIGDNAIILPRVNVGDGAIVGAGSVVFQEFPAYHVVADVPAKVIKKRFSEEIINEIRVLSGWDWEPEKIKNNKALFDVDLNVTSVNEVRALLETVS